MASTIPMAMVEQFSANVFLQTQQEETILRPTVYTESVKGMSKYVDSIGRVARPVKVTTRHAPTPIVATPHERRQLSLEFYSHGDMIDEIDKVRMLYDPTSIYVKAFSAIFGTEIDRIILDQIVGTARIGQKGESTKELPDKQKIDAVAAFTVAELRAIKQVFDWNNVKEKEKKYLCISPDEVAKLLADTELTSSDYNTVKALVDGKVDTFMGFTFVKSTVIPTHVVGGVTKRKCVAYTSDAFRLGIGINPTIRITENPNYSYGVQVFMRMGLGGVRVEDRKVVQVDCNV